jgi:hypothetical protein
MITKVNTISTLKLPHANLLKLPHANLLQIGMKLMLHYLVVTKKQKNVCGDITIWDIDPGHPGARLATPCSSLGSLD